MLTGNVKFFRSDKGYGFIENGCSNDIFVHSTSLVNCDHLRKGVCVSFEVIVTKRGLEARNVQLNRSDTSYIGVHQVDHSHIYS